MIAQGKRGYARHAQGHAASLQMNAIKRGEDKGTPRPGPNAGVASYVIS